MNALRLLTAQHDRLEELSAQLGEAAAKGEEGRRSALSGFLREARQHFDVEEACFYPAVSSKLILVEAAPLLEEHQALRAALDRLEERGQVGGPELEQARKSLHEKLVQHVSEEEIELFPEVRRRFDVDALDALGERMERFLEAEPAAVAPEAATAPEAVAPQQEERPLEQPEPTEPQHPSG